MPLSSEMKKAGKSFADEGTTEEAAQKEYRAIAERRVRLGLVLGTLGEKEGIQVNEQELQQSLMARARQFPGQEKQVFDHYRKNPNALIELRGPVFEQKVVDFLVSKAKVTEKSVSREELQAMVQDDDEDHSGHDHEHGDHDHDHDATTMTTRTIITMITTMPKPSRRRNRLPKRPRRKTKPNRHRLRQTPQSPHPPVGDLLPCVPHGRRRNFLRLSLSLSRATSKPMGEVCLYQRRRMKAFGNSCPFLK